MVLRQVPQCIVYTVYRSSTRIFNANNSERDTRFADENAIRVIHFGRSERQIGQPYKSAGEPINYPNFWLTFMAFTFIACSTTGRKS